MSSWLKKIHPVQLCQSNAIPYVILEDGVLLCFDNFYSIKPDKEDLSAYSIIFYSEKSELKRKTTNYYEFKKFPVFIDFKNILKLNNCISDNTIDLNKPSSVEEYSNICVISDTYIKELEEEKILEMSDIIEGYDNSFILLKEDTPDDRIRSFIDINNIHTVTHVDWYRTGVEMIHNISSRSDKSCCWTSASTEMNIDIFCIGNADECIHIKEVFRDIGARSDISWKTTD